MLTLALTSMEKVPPLRGTSTLSLFTNMESFWACFIVTGISKSPFFIETSPVLESVLSFLETVYHSSVSLDFDEL